MDAFWGFGNALAVKVDASVDRKHSVPAAAAPVLAGAQPHTAEGSLIQNVRWFDSGSGHRASIGDCCEEGQSGQN